MKFHFGHHAFRCLNLVLIFLKMTQFEEGQYCFIFTKIRTKLKLKTNIGTKLSHFDTWHNCEVTCVKKKKIQKKNTKNIKKIKKKTEIDT